MPQRDRLCKALTANRKKQDACVAWPTRQQTALVAKTKVFWFFFSKKNCFPIFSLLVPLFPAGCSPSPSQYILGSFFPSWLLCTAIGVGVTVMLRLLLGVTGVDKHVLAPPLTYLAVAVAVTLFTWLVRFGQ